jgi:hypothetical protein
MRIKAALAALASAAVLVMAVPQTAFAAPVGAGSLAAPQKLSTGLVVEVGRRWRGYRYGYYRPYYRPGYYPYYAPYYRPYYYGSYYGAYGYPYYAPSYRPYYYGGYAPGFYGRFYGPRFGFSIGY